MERYIQYIGNSIPSQAVTIENTSISYLTLTIICSQGLHHMNLLSLMQNWRRWSKKQRDDFPEKDVGKE
jgi:hypothetical protein